MMERLLNAARRETQRVLSMLALPKTGIVSGYDPTSYAAKVRLQPEDTETGWLPIRTPWAGNGWGMFAPPNIGDEVEVQFQEGGKQAGYVCLRAFGDRARPLSVPAGEMWMVHKSGAAFTLTNDGRATMRDGFGSHFTLNNDGTASASLTGNAAFSCPRINYTGIVNAAQFYGNGTPPIPDGIYRTGLGLSQDGFITIRGGVIIALQEAQ